MEEVSFKPLIESEEVGRHSLVRACWKNWMRFCIRCRGRRLKEMEFRYNHRDEPIFGTLVQYVCNLTVT
jgi:hypothetical protein